MDPIPRAGSARAPSVVSSRPWHTQVLEGLSSLGLFGVAALLLLASAYFWREQTRWGASQLPIWELFGILAVTAGFGGVLVRFAERAGPASTSPPAVPENGGHPPAPRPPDPSVPGPPEAGPTPRSAAPTLERGRPRPTTRSTTLPVPGKLDDTAVALQELDELGEALKGGRKPRPAPVDGNPPE